MSQTGLSRNVCAVVAIVAVLGVFISSVGAAQQPPPPEKDPLADLPAKPWPLGRSPTEDESRRGRSRLALRSAKPIPPEDVRAYARRLRLSEAQKAHLATIYRTYRVSVDELHAARGPRIGDLSLEAADHMTAKYDFDFVKQFAELRGLENDYERDLVRLEERMFAELLPMLAEEQWPLLDAVKLRRARNRCSQLDIEIYEAQIDLTSILEKADLDDDTLRDLEPTLLEYERAITPLWLDIHQQRDKTNVENARLTAMSMFRDDGSLIEQPASDVDRARAENARAQRERLSAATVPKQDRLAEINWRFLPGVLELIPEPRRSHVHAEFLRHAHPRVYPDLHDPKELLDAAIATLPADAESLPLIRASWDTFRRTYDALTKEMIEGVRQWNRHMTLTNSHDPAPANAVREARFKRWEASEKFVDQMLSMLPPESVAALERQVDNFRQRLNAEREREKDPRMANP